MLVKDTGGSVDFEPAPMGNHVARCISIIDLGTQTGEYMGEVTKKRQLFFTFELPNEMKTYTVEGQEITEPFTVTKFYTASLNEKANLRKDLESWRGRAFTEQELAGFDIKNVLGHACMVNVVHKEKRGGGVSANIVSVNSLPKGMECPAQVNESFIFDLDNYDEESFQKVSKGLKAMIEKSPEYQNVLTGGSVDQSSGGEFDQDIPFSHHMKNAEYMV